MMVIWSTTLNTKAMRINIACIILFNKNNSDPLCVKKQNETNVLCIVILKSKSKKDHLNV